MVGKRFSNLVVIERAGGENGAKWLCQCDCGNTKVISGNVLRQGSTKSCGCVRKQNNQGFKHGHCSSGISPTYNSWAAMHGRCKYPKTRSYEHYGGRGISVCERWGDFANFLEDMGERPVGTSLDRIDADGNYEPGNCRWATDAEQRANRRGTRGE